eukprot:UN03087
MLAEQEGNIKSKDSELQKVIEQFNDLIATTKQEKEGLATEIQSIKKREDTMFNKVLDLNKELLEKEKELEKRNFELQTKQSEWRVTSEKSHSELIILRQKFTEEKNDFEITKRSQNDKIATDRHEIQMKQEDLKRKIVNHEKEHSELSKAKKSFDKKVGAFEIKLENMKTMNNTFEKESETVRWKYDQVQKIEKETTTKFNEITLQTEAIKKERVRLDALQTQMTEEKKEIEQARLEYMKLQQILKKRIDEQKVNEERERKQNVLLNNTARIRKEQKSGKRSKLSPQYDTSSDSTQDEPRRTNFSYSNICKELDNYR